MTKSIAIHTAYRRVSVLERSSASKQLELLERLELLEQASLRCVQSDGGPRSAGQTENSFRQSQTILRDLKHHSLPKRHCSFWGGVFKFAIHMSRSTDMTISIVLRLACAVAIVVCITAQRD